MTLLFTQGQLGDLVKQVRTPPVRPADGVVGCVYESFVPGVWHRWMEKEILWFCFRRAEPERMISGWTASPGRFSPERKTPPGVSTPSAGLRPLSVSRVKCGGGPCRGHSVLPCVGNTICLQYAFYKKLWRI